MIDPIASQERSRFRRRRQPEPEQGCIPSLVMVPKVNGKASQGTRKGARQEPVTIMPCTLQNTDSEHEWYVNKWPCRSHTPYLHYDCFITVSSPILQAAVRLKWLQSVARGPNNSETDSGKMPIIGYHDK